MAARNEQNKERGVNAVLLRLAGRLSWNSAAIGGVVTFGIAVLVTISVLKRSFGFGGIQGDFEVVKLGCGIAAFLFLPLCQFKRGHVTVDLFSDWLSRRMRLGLEAIWQIIFAVVWVALAWRLLTGGLETYEYHDRTMLLRFPIWFVYLPAVFGTFLSALVAFCNAVPLLRGQKTSAGILK